MTILVDVLRQALQQVSLRHDWANHLDNTDRTQEIADAYEALLPQPSSSKKEVQLGLDGPPCLDCGGITQRTGACYTCTGCGSTTGCG